MRYLLLALLLTCCGCAAVVLPQAGLPDAAAEPAARDDQSAADTAERPADAAETAAFAPPDAPPLVPDADVVPAAWSGPDAAPWGPLVPPWAPAVEGLPSLDELAAAEAATPTDRPDAPAPLVPLEEFQWPSGAGGLREPLSPLDVTAVGGAASEEIQPPSPWQRRVRGVLDDHRHFYEARSLLKLGGGIFFGAALANTAADPELREFYQEDFLGHASRSWENALHQPKEFGNVYLVMPTLAAVAVTGMFFPEGSAASAVGAWSESSLRGGLVGMPWLLSMQVLTGGARPGNSPDGARWEPFQAPNGVSGHAFVGAVPLITAAKRTDNPWWKALFYAGSVLPGLSRFNDDAHYPSQVFLGWWLAYLAASAVDQTEEDRKTVAIGPAPMDNGMGVGVEYRH